MNIRKQHVFPLAVKHRVNNLKSSVIHLKNFSEVKNDVFVTNTSEELSTHVRKALGCIIIRLF